MLLAQEMVRSTPPIQAATALKHASCDQTSLKNHKKMQFVRKLVTRQWWVGKSLRSTLERHRNDFWSFLGLFILRRLRTRWRPDTRKQDKIWNVGVKCSISKIRISRHLQHQSAAFFPKNSKMAIRNSEEWVRHVKMPKNRVFCNNFRWPLCFPISTPRRGASHQFAATYP